MIQKRGFRPTRNHQLATTFSKKIQPVQAPQITRARMRFYYSVVLTFAFIFAAASLAFPNDDISQDQLAKLNDERIEEILEITSKIQQWRSDIKKLEELLNNSQVGVVDLEDGVIAQNDPSQNVFEIAEFVISRKQTLEEFVNLGTNIEDRIRQVKNSGVNVIPDDELELTSQEWNEITSSFIRIDAAETILADLKSAFDVLEKLKDPAAYAKDFLENKLRKQFLNKKYTLGKFEFTFKDADPSESLFSEKAKINVLIEYGNSIPPVEVTGIYFRYIKGNPLPEPVFDNVRVDETKLMNDFIGKSLVGISSEIPGPIKVKKITPPSFGGSGNGGIGLEIEMSFYGEFPSLMGAVEIFPNGRCVLGTIGCTVNGLEIPLGTTGFTFQRFSLTYRQPANGKNAVIVGETYLSTASSSRAYALKLELEVELPVSSITFEGDLILVDKENLSIANVEFVYDRDENNFAGKCSIPGKEGTAIPIGSILQTQGRGEFRLDETGFYATGNLNVYGLPVADAEIAILSNGHGYIDASAGVDLCGQKIYQGLTMSYTPGFDEFLLEIDFDVNGIDVKPWGDLGVQVYVTADESGPVYVSLNAGPVSSIDIPVASLDDIDAQWIAKKLASNPQQYWEDFLLQLSRAEADIRDLSAKMTKKASDFIDKHYGFTVDTDATLQGIRRQANALGVKTTGIGKFVESKFGALSNGATETFEKAGDFMSDVTKWPKD